MLSRPMTSRVSRGMKISPFSESEFNRRVLRALLPIFLEMEDYHALEACGNDGFRLSAASVLGIPGFLTVNRRLVRSLRFPLCLLGNRLPDLAVETSRFENFERLSFILT